MVCETATFGIEPITSKYEPSELGESQLPPLPTGSEALGLAPDRASLLGMELVQLVV